MYLSRVRLNVEKRNTQLVLASPNKIHGAVERCFSEKGERKLWRIDKLGGNYYLLIVSPEKPCFSDIKKKYGYVEDADEIKSYDRFLQSIQDGSIWQFRLVANPTRSENKGQETRGKVVAHVSERYQMEWLNEKSLKNGFTILTEGSCVVGSDWKTFSRNGSRSKVRLKEAVFQGVLKVDNADLFRKALINGIGRGKAYGMGLMTIMSV